MAMHPPASPRHGPIWIPSMKSVERVRSHSMSDTSEGPPSARSYSPASCPWKIPAPSTSIDPVIDLETTPNSHDAWSHKRHGEAYNSLRSSEEDQLSLLRAKSDDADAFSSGEDDDEDDDQSDSGIFNIEHLHTTTTTTSKDAEIVDVDEEEDHLLSPPLSHEEALVEDIEKSLMTPPKKALSSPFSKRAYMTSMRVEVL